MRRDRKVFQQRCPRIRPTNMIQTHDALRQLRSASEQARIDALRSLARGAPRQPLPDLLASAVLAAFGSSPPWRDELVDLVAFRPHVEFVELACDMIRHGSVGQQQTILQGVGGYAMFGATRLVSLRAALLDCLNLENAATLFYASLQLYRWTNDPTYLGTTARAIRQSDDGPWHSSIRSMADEVLSDVEREFVNAALTTAGVQSIQPPSSLDDAVCFVLSRSKIER